MAAVLPPEYGTATALPSAEAVPDGVAPAGPTADEEHAEAVREAVAASPEGAGEGHGEPITLVDTGAPPPPPLPAASKSDAAGAIAILVAGIDADARDMITHAQREAYPRGMLLEAFPTIGDEFLPELIGMLGSQYNEIARLAGISQEELDQKVVEGTVRPQPLLSVRLFERLFRSPARCRECNSRAEE